MLHPIYVMRRSGIVTEFDSYWANIGLKDYLSTLNKGTEVLYNAIRAYAKILYTASLQNTEKKFFLDKTPRYYFIINELIDIFPNAKFIVLKRNPLAILASVLDTWIKNDYHKIDKYKYDLVTSIKNLLNVKNKEKIYWVKYEHIVKNPYSTIKPLINRLNLIFESQILEYGKFPRPKGTMGDSTNVDKLKYPSMKFIDRWKIILNKNAIYWHIANFYLELLGPQKIEEWGYSFKDLKNFLNKKEYKLNLEENTIFNSIKKIFNTIIKNGHANNAHLGL